MQTPFDLIGGENKVRALVDRFYDVMDTDPACAVIRQLHPADLSGSRDKLYWFLSGWMGGPDLYVSQFGHPRLRARHMPFSVGVAERDQWLSCMRSALAETTDDAVLSERLMGSFMQTADFMRNRAEEGVAPMWRGPQIT